MTRRLSLKFWLSIKNALQKHCKHEKQWNKIVTISLHLPLFTQESATCTFEFSLFDGLLLIVLFYPCMSLPPFFTFMTNQPAYPRQFYKTQRNAWPLCVPNWSSYCPNSTGLYFQTINLLFCIITCLLRSIILNTTISSMNSL